MSEKTNEKPGSQESYDPFESWRKARDAGMEAWAKTMVEYVNSDAYSQASGAMLDTYLTGSAPFREMLEKIMVRALDQLGMPSRADFASIARRLTNIEIRLDDLDAKLDRMEASRVESAPPGTGRKQKES